MQKSQRYTEENNYKECGGGANEKLLGCEKRLKFARQVIMTGISVRMLDAAEMKMER